MEIQRAIVCFIQMIGLGAKAFDWFTPGNDNVVGLIGCNIQLQWNLQIKNFETSVKKKENKSFNDIERYTIYKKETEEGFDIYMNIPRVTINDSGVYRCVVDETQKYKDINLTVMDFKWKTDSKSIEVKKGGDITMDWEYITKAVSEDILVYRISPFGDKSRRDLVQLKIENMEVSKTDDRVTVSLNTDGKGTTTVIFTLRKVTEEDVNYNYIIEFRHSDSCSMISEPILLNEEPRFVVPNQAVLGRIGQNIRVVFKYNYRFEAVNVTVSRIDQSGVSFELGCWGEKPFYPVDKRLLFRKESTPQDQRQISLTILDTILQDYDATYKFDVIFENGYRSSVEIEVNLQPEKEIPETKKMSFEPTLLIVLLIIMILACFLVGFFVRGFKRKSHDTERPEHNNISENNSFNFNNPGGISTIPDSTSTDTDISSNDTNAYANPYDPINRDNIDIRKNFYMSLLNPGTRETEQDGVNETNIDDNSVVSRDDVHASVSSDDNRDTSSNDEGTYANPYNSINREDIDTSKNFYMPLQNLGTPKTEQHDVHETNVDDNSVVIIDDVHDFVTSDDDTATRNSNPYDALDKDAKSTNVHSYLSLPQCSEPVWEEDEISSNSRNVDRVMIKKRPSTI